MIIFILYNGERPYRWLSPSTVLYQWATMALIRDLSGFMHINEQNPDRHLYSGSPTL